MESPLYQVARTYTYTTWIIDIAVVAIIVALHVPALLIQQLQQASGFLSDEINTLLVVDKRDGRPLNPLHFILSLHKDKREREREKS